MAAPSEDSVWARAATLHERAAALPSAPLRAAGEEPPGEAALRRLERWRTQPPFGREIPFSERLERDGLTEADLLHLLGEPAEALHARLPGEPPWLRELHRALASREPPEPILLPPQLRGQPDAELVQVFEPLVSAARRRLRRAARELAASRPGAPFDPDTAVDLLFQPLPVQLLYLTGRTLVLELNIARLEGRLRGETPAERFRSFVEGLREPGALLGLLRTYPVLARQLVTRLDNWVDAGRELLRRLADDRDAIREAFRAGEDPGPLTELQGGMGDRHRGGRVVMVLGFASGFRVVYKPRPMAVDVHFQELLAWLNQRGGHPPFRTLRVLDRGAYGWMEFVEARGCEDEGEVRRFYERLGGYLALLYALEATDFHYENLIASGEHPVLIDLESLAQPRLPAEGGEEADQVTSHSVLRVGLLPQRAWESEEREGLDLSGIGTAEGQLTPHAVPQYEGSGTDEMRMTRRRVEMRGGANRPTLRGAEVDPMAHAGAFLEGFTGVYRLLAAHREALWAEGGPLARLADDEVRAILRPTRTYALLLQESYHPHLLQDALDRDRHFDRLWVAAARQPVLARAIPAERADLEGGDIPFFTIRPSSREARDSRGSPVPGLFQASGLELARARIAGFGEEDLRRQRWFIEASLATLAPGFEQAVSATYSRGEPAGRAEPLRLLECARAVGDRLETLALRGEEGVSWVGLTSSQGKRWRLEPVGLDLYNGLPGIALFLAELGAATGEERYTALARAALASVRRRAEPLRSTLRLVGAYTGWGGIVYALARLGALWEEPGLLEEAGEVVELLPALVEQEEKLDVIGGAAGCIGALLALHHAAPAVRTLEVARLCGEHLLAHALPMAEGVGWDTKGVAKAPQAGFAHGAAGIAWALLELAGATGDGRYREAALQGMAYERTLFVPEAGNWQDIRELPRPELARRVGGYQFMITWCYGAPGVGLSRLRALSRVPSPEIEEELRTALDTTLREGFGTNHSLCHGDLGNLELPLLAARTLPDPGLPERVDRLASGIVEGITRTGWLCGTPNAVETPGLMMGLAGIGYQLLRLADPERVPSVLLLEPAGVRASAEPRTPVLTPSARSPG